MINFLVKTITAPRRRKWEGGQFAYVFAYVTILIDEFRHEYKMARQKRKI